MLEVLMMTMGKLVIGLNDWPTRTASNLQQSHLDLTSCQLFPGCSLDCQLCIIFPTLSLKSSLTGHLDG